MDIKVLVYTLGSARKSLNDEQKKKYAEYSNNIKKAFCRLAEYTNPEISVEGKKF